MGERVAHAAAQETYIVYCVSQFFYSISQFDRDNLRAAAEEELQRERGGEGGGGRDDDAASNKSDLKKGRIFAAAEAAAAADLKLEVRVAIA